MPIKNTPNIITQSPIYSLSLSDLQIGGVYKNYQELCKVLSTVPVTGNQKKLQMKHWNNYFSYIKTGRSFTVTDIFYPTKQHARLSEQQYYQSIKTGPYTSLNYRRSKYSYYLVPLLVSLICKKEELTFTYSDLFYKLGFVNQKYNNLRTQCQKADQTKWVLTNFYRLSFFTIFPALNKTLTSMKNKEIIDYYLNETVYKKIGESTIPLSESEMELYNGAKERILDNHNFQNPLKETYYLKTKDFKSQICNELYGPDHGIDELIINKVIVIKLLLSESVPVLSSTVLHDYKIRVNHNIRSAIHTDILKDYNKNKERTDVFYGDNYLNTIDKLLQTYITIN